jgi:hypothetical protein
MNQERSADADRDPCCQLLNGVMKTAFLDETKEIGSCGPGGFASSKNTYCLHKV